MFHSNFGSVISGCEHLRSCTGGARIFARISGRGTGGNRWRGIGLKRFGKAGLLFGWGVGPVVLGSGCQRLLTRGCLGLDRRG